ncbi:Gp15 family bacteriophage protein [uncultured Streptococcus sp.]|jgi:hypothetical protein|uniref:Gp15 family bacteriophage protein n=1 Tax=uncultured Streptococcus sp. TaxID=83427 RepID=UPI0028CFFFAB|nr:Gp15 family bacteriophage protein [uncultured Streptococcus sp.]
MFDLSRRFRDELVLDDTSYPLDLSFDNVLRLFDMIHDDYIPVIAKPIFALKILLKTSTDRDKQAADNLLEHLDIETALEIYKRISEEHVVIKSSRGEVKEYDLAGNLIERTPIDDDEEEDEKEPLFSLKYDGVYIYSSFLQAYNIDLIEAQGKLHWQKFNALLNGLPSNTKFAEVLKIRSWEPQKDDTQEYISSMRKLQTEYALPEEIDY